MKQLTVTKASNQMVVDHTDGLHEGIADGGPYESKATFF
jgi:hypothetical protein